ncbi:MAG TPA: tRNA preQ1(34) S-adenosylmethionine ribosyltransferase-isomerase QueA, partial [Nitrospirota bacterium]|nr:tRNA preQ1(34) S-adenosylmethionine ribosyltransferase-isomerase QueA [Nitrospirota bacterium]
MFNLSDYDYPFDPSLIAQYPVSVRDQSGLLVLNRADSSIEHRRFYNVIEYLREGDILVLNNTKVVPCRLVGEKDGTGGRVELLLIKKHGDQIWESISNKKLRNGVKIKFSDKCCGEVIGVENSNYLVKFNYSSDGGMFLSDIGQMPVPPYIKRKSCEEDKERYQTVYAAEDGAIAAPTAGLHFTKELIGILNSRGVTTVYVTLHVGIGTFRPVKSENIELHKMEYEKVNIPEVVVKHILQAKNNGGRLIAVGTTTVRALEHAAISGILHPAMGDTGLFIYPGFKFNVVDAMITNFHLPKSTLLLLVMAFAGRENILNSYAEAVARKY